MKFIVQTPENHIPMETKVTKHHLTNTSNGTERFINPTPKGMMGKKGGFLSDRVVLSTINSCPISCPTPCPTSDKSDNVGQALSDAFYRQQTNKNIIKTYKNHSLYHVTVPYIYLTLPKEIKV